MTYLVQGRDAAVLIDTGVGVGNLRAVVDRLTDKPLSVTIPHGHVDHAMGAPLFKDRPLYLSHADLPILPAYGDAVLRHMYVKAFHHGRTVADELYVPFETLDYRDLHSGDDFDLGGLHLVAYPLAGHTAGSFIILLVEPRILITGDACNPSVFLFLPEARPVHEYMANLQAVIPLVAGRYDAVCFSHDGGDGGADMLDSALEVTRQIMAGTTDDIPFHFLSYHACVAKATNHLTHRRRDGGSANIIYDPHRK